MDRRAVTGLESDIQHNGHGHGEHFADGSGNAGRQVGGVAFAHLKLQWPPCLVKRRIERGGPKVGEYPGQVSEKGWRRGEPLGVCSHCDFGLRWRIVKGRKGG